MHKWNHFSFNPWRIPPSQLVDAIGLQAWKLSLWFGSGCKKNTPTPEIGSTKINPFFFFVFFLDVSRFAHRGEKNYILNSNEHIHFFFHSCYVNFYFVYLFLYPFFHFLFVFTTFYEGTKHCQPQRRTQPFLAIS